MLLCNFMLLCVCFWWFLTTGAYVIWMDLILVICSCNWRSKSKAQVSYCPSPQYVVRRRPSSVNRRPSVRKLKHFKLLLQNRLMDFDKKIQGWSWSLTSVVVFSQIRPGVDQRRGKIGHGDPFSRKFFFTPGGYSNKPNA